MIARSRPTAHQHRASIAIRSILTVLVPHTFAHDIDNSCLNSITFIVMIGIKRYTPRDSGWSSKWSGTSSIIIVLGCSQSWINLRALSRCWRSLLRCDATSQDAVTQEHSSPKDGKYEVFMPSMSIALQSAVHAFERG
eukprot:6471244-Amphidinium_carterae.2